ncbi:MAG: T9SS type A sorting domain-containing protein, partial [Balneola sp.]
MKRLLLSFGLCLLMAGMSFGQSTILLEDFEDGTVKYTTSITEFTDGGTDYFQRTTSPTGTFTNVLGSGIFEAQDIDAEGATLPVTLNINDIDISGYSSLEIRVYLAEDDDGANQDWDSGDYLHITGDIDDGATQNLIWIENDGTTFNTAPLLDTDFDGTGDGTEITNAFVQFTASISGTGSLLDLAFEFQLDSGDEDIAIDNIEVVGTATGLPSKIISGNDGWRLLSIPKTSATVSDISDDTAIQGVTGGSDASASSNVFTYDNTGSYEKPTNVSTAIGDGYGLAVFFYNNTTNGSSALPLTLDVSGSEPSSDVGVTLNKSNTAGTSSGSGAADSYYTLVGNPFASNYNLNSITVTGGAIQDNVQFWNDGTSSYSAQARTTPYIVSPWQAFWVEVLNANAATSITFPTSGKSTSSATGTFFSKENPNSADINFTLSSETTFDEAIKLSFRDYAELGMDRADASKLVPLVTNYATMAFVGEYQNEEKLKSVESLPSNLEEAITIPLRPTLVGVSGEFTFSWDGIEALSNKMSFTLHDYETGTDIDMAEMDSYVFIAEANTASKSKSVLLPVVAESESGNAENRFGITITPSTSVSIDDEVDAPTEFALGQNYPNPFNPTTNINYSVGEAGPVNITVYNVMGQKVAELLNTTKNAGSYQLTWNATGVASGIYYYRLTA